MSKPYANILKRILLLMMALLTLFSCIACVKKEEEKPTYSESAISAFTASLANRDFAAAYKYFWKYGGLKKQEVFTADCEYILNALKVTDIELKNVRAEEDDNGQYVLKYTAALTCETAGLIESDISTFIVIENGNTYVHYTRSLLLSDFDEGDMIITSTVAGKRGEILTEDGEAVAVNSYADTVYINPLLIDEEQYPSVISRIGGIVDLSARDIKNAERNYKTAREKNYGTSVIASFGKDSIDAATEAALSAIEGVYVDRTSLTSQRYYPDANIYSHIVGYANAPSSEEQENFIKDGGYSPASVYGKEGVEKSYNEMLLSKDGLSITVTNENYSVKRVLYRREPENGATVQLTVNSRVQENIYYTMHELLTDKQTAAAIVLDYSNAAVKGMVSFPSYDPNTFAYSISAEEYQRLFEAEEAGQPLFPRTTLGLYPPGSVIKPLLAGPALDEGVITENTEFPYRIIDNMWYPEGWSGKGVSRSYDSGSPLVLYNAITKSDNIYFSWVGMKMGQEKLFDAFKKLGFEESYDFDLPVATSNMINDDTKILPSMLADMAIGHGEVLVSPLQITALYTLFTNGGSSLKPYIVDKAFIEDDDGETVLYEAGRTVLKENIMSQNSVDTIRKGLRGVVTEGTARSINDRERVIYAKTGTAIKSQNSDERISWLCAWIEDDEDHRLVLVMVDGPQAEDTVKFDIAKALLK